MLPPPDGAGNQLEVQFAGGETSAAWIKIWNSPLSALVLLPYTGLPSGYVRLLLSPSAYTLRLFGIR